MSKWDAASLRAGLAKVTKPTVDSPNALARASANLWNPTNLRKFTAAIPAPVQKTLAETRQQYDKYMPIDPNADVTIEMRPEATAPLWKNILSLAKVDITGLFKTKFTEDVNARRSLVGAISEQLHVYESDWSKVPAPLKSVLAGTAKIGSSLLAVLLANAENPRALKFGYFSYTPAYSKDAAVATEEKRLEADSQEAAQWLSANIDGINKYVEKNLSAPITATPTQRFIYDVAGALPSIVASRWLGIATQNPGAVGVLFGAIAGGDAYKTFREHGLTPEKAMARAFTVGFGEGALETEFLTRFLDPKGLSLIKNAVLRIGNEAAQEFTQEISSTVQTDITLKFWKDQKIPMSERIANEVTKVFKQAAYAGLIGGIIGVPEAGVMFNAEQHSATSQISKKLQEFGVKRQIANIAATKYVDKMMKKAQQIGTDASWDKKTTKPVVSPTEVLAAEQPAVTPEAKETETTGVQQETAPVVQAKVVPAATGVAQAKGAARGNKWNPSRLRETSPVAEVSPDQPSVSTAAPVIAPEIVPAEVTPQEAAVATPPKTTVPETAQNTKPTEAATFLKDDEGKIVRVVDWSGEDPIVVYPGKDGGVVPYTGLPRRYDLAGSEYYPVTLAEFDKVIKPSGSEHMITLRQWRDEFQRSLTPETTDTTPIGVPVAEVPVSEPAQQPDRRTAAPMTRQHVQQEMARLVAAGDTAGAQALVEQVRNEGRIDQLTGLKNRVGWEEADKEGKTVASCDVSGLKYVNDTYGHDFGDSLLVMVSAAFQVNGVDAYRIGGDEFAGLFGSAEEAAAKMAAVQQTLSEQELLVKTNGVTKALTGWRIDYGTGQDYAAADAALLSDRADREAKGLRPARGTNPLGNPAVTAPGVPAQVATDRALSQVRPRAAEEVARAKDKLTPWVVEGRQPSPAEIYNWFLGSGYTLYNGEEDNPAMQLFDPKEVKKVLRLQRLFRANGAIREGLDTAYELLTREWGVDAQHTDMRDDEWLAHILTIGAYGGDAASKVDVFGAPTVAVQIAQAKKQEAVAGKTNIFGEAVAQKKGPAVKEELPLAPGQKAFATTAEKNAAERGRSMEVQRQKLAGRGAGEGMFAPVEETLMPEQPTPGSIGDSLRQAREATDAHLAEYRAKTNALPDGTIIDGWQKWTLAGDVLWEKGRKHVTDIIVEVGQKAVDDVIANPPNTKLHPRAETGPAKEPWEMTEAERNAKIVALKEQYKRELATPLMSEGSISPMQVGQMSKNQKARYQADTMTRMDVEGEIRQLNNPQEAKAQYERGIATDKEGRIAGLRANIAAMELLGKGKNGAVKPKYAAQIAKNQAEIDQLTGVDRTSRDSLIGYKDNSWTLVGFDKDGSPLWTNPRNKTPEKHSEDAQWVKDNLAWNNRTPEQIAAYEAQAKEAGKIISAAFGAAEKAQGPIQERQAQARSKKVKDRFDIARTFVGKRVTSYGGGQDDVIAVNRNSDGAIEYTVVDVADGKVRTHTTQITRQQVVGDASAANMAKVTTTPTVQEEPAAVTKKGKAAKKYVSEMTAQEAADYMASDKFVENDDLDRMARSAIALDSKYNQLKQEQQRYRRDNNDTSPEIQSRMQDRFDEIHDKFYHMAAIAQAMNNKVKYLENWREVYPDLQDYFAIPVSMAAVTQEEKVDALFRKQVGAETGQELVSTKSVDEIIEDLTAKIPGLRDIAIEVSDMVVEATEAERKWHNIYPGDAGWHITGETLIGLRNGVMRTVIKLYHGADAQTVVEEAAHAGWIGLSPEDRAAYRSYHTRSGDARSVEEHFAQDMTDWLMKGGDTVHPQRTIFQRIALWFKRLLARVRDVHVLSEDIEDLYRKAMSAAGTGAATYEGTQTMYAMKKNDEIKIEEREATPTLDAGSAARFIVDKLDVALKKYAPKGTKVTKAQAGSFQEAYEKTLKALGLPKKLLDLTTMNGYINSRGEKSLQHRIDMVTKAIEAYQKTHAVDILKSMKISDLPAEYQRQVFATLNKLGIKRKASQSVFTKAGASGFEEELRAAGIDVSEDTVMADALFEFPIKALSADQAIKVATLLKQIEQGARWELQQHKAQREAAIKKLVDEGLAALDKLKTTQKPQAQVITGTERPNWVDNFFTGLKHLYLQSADMRVIAATMDNLEADGIFTKLIGMLIDGQHNADSALNNWEEQFHDAAISLRLGTNWEEVKLHLRSRRMVDGFTDAPTVDELLGIAGAAGNAKSLMHLEGNGITHDMIVAAIRSLTSEEKGLLDWMKAEYANHYEVLQQAVYEINDTILPFEPNYWPSVVIRSGEGRATVLETAIEHGVGTNPSARNVLNERMIKAKKGGGQPVILGAVYNYLDWMNQVLYLENIKVPLSHVIRTVNDPEFKAKFLAKFGEQTYRAWTDYLTAVADPQAALRPRNEWERWMRTMRLHASTAILGDVIHGLKMGISLTSGIAQFGPLNIAMAAKIMSDRGKGIALVREYMPILFRSSPELEMSQRSLMEARGEIRQSGVVKFVDAFATVMDRADRFTAGVAGMLEYQRRHPGTSLEEAGKWSEQQVLKTHMTQSMVYMPAALRSGELPRIFYMFIGELSKQSYEEKLLIRQAIKDHGKSIGSTLNFTFWTFMVGSIIENALAGLLQPPDKKERWGDSNAASMLDAALRITLNPVLASYMSRAFKGYNDLTPVPLKFITYGIQGMNGMINATKNQTWDENMSGILWDWLGMVTYMTGYPYEGIKKANNWYNAVRAQQSKGK